MVILLFATTTKCLSMQTEIEGFFFFFRTKMRTTRTTSTETEGEKKQTERMLKQKKRNRTESTMCLEKSVIIPQKVERKEPGRSPGGSARLVWHLTSSSLYTELITVMQRAQYYSNKARERKRKRERSTETKTNEKKTQEQEEKREAQRHFPPDETSPVCVNSCPDAVKFPPRKYEKYPTVHTDLCDINFFLGFLTAKAEIDGKNLVRLYLAEADEK